MGAYEKSLKDLEPAWERSQPGSPAGQKNYRQRRFREGNEIDLTFDLIGRYQKELRAHAVPLAERIYEEKPRDFTRRMRHLWDTWQAEPASNGAH